MKIAVITAIFGGIDTPKPFCEQSVPCDRFVITEQNTPVPLPNLPPRLRAKYFKLQPHKIWPGYDVYIWVDGNLEITNPDFVKVMTDGFWGSVVTKMGEIRIQRHHERQTIGEEIAHILGSDAEYLVTRYGSQPLREEYGYYLASGMKETVPLYSCNLFSWENNMQMRLFFDKWFYLVLTWSWFDQSAFSFLAWKHEVVSPVDLGPYYNNPYFIHHNHERIQ